MINQKKFANDTFSVLNYQGSKKQLLEFIYNTTNNYIDPNKAFLDIFSGSAAVGYSMKRYTQVYSNDSEMYAYQISKALIENNTKLNIYKYLQAIKNYYNENYEKLLENFGEFVQKEEEILMLGEEHNIIAFYEEYPCIWQEDRSVRIKGKEITDTKSMRNLSKDIPYMLFTTYYASTYFGVKQCMEIDSIRYSIEKIADNYLKSAMYTALFFAMKECVFSKDGHMAQPLDKYKNIKKLAKVRRYSIVECFFGKLNEFGSDSFITTEKSNKVFNLDFNELLTQEELLNEVGFIYADPPYTDMQYSRYYHLLNTVVQYDYPDISLNRGNISTGVYREGRFQSNLSKRSKASIEIDRLFQCAKNHTINIALSFAYPRDPEKQATNRYTMNIDDIIKIAELHYGRDKVIVETEEYEHSNNRNKSNKKVLEYIIMGIN